MGKSTISMVHGFNSYVKVPEGADFGGQKPESLLAIWESHGGITVHVLTASMFGVFGIPPVEPRLLVL